MSLYRPAWLIPRAEWKRRLRKVVWIGEVSWTDDKERAARQRAEARARLEGRGIVRPIEAEPEPEELVDEHPRRRRRKQDGRPPG